MTRTAAPADAVRVTALGNGVIVTHDFGHACCLSAHTTSRVEGQRVIITEVLEGQPCRCRCTSSLRTTLGLSAGAYQLELQLVSAGQTQLVHAEDVEIGIRRVPPRWK